MGCTGAYKKQRLSTVVDISVVQGSTSVVRIPLDIKVCIRVADTHFHIREDDVCVYEHAIFPITFKFSCYV